MHHDPNRWTPLDSWAATHGVTMSDAIRSIQAGGRITAGRIEGRWHICESRVELTHPDPSDAEHVRLRIAATREGRCLTAGREILTLEFRYDSNACHDAVTALTLACEPPGTELVAIRLGDDFWLIHRSLHADLAAALLCLEVEMDLGDLMAQYRPDPLTLN